MVNYLPIIGLEIHVELRTKSKMFCGCPADHFGKKPNTQTCPVCLGLPGALPVPNKKAIEWTVLLGLALGCEVQLESKFDRKNYFYPDLSKGYQISQYDKPFAVNGALEIVSADKPGDPSTALGMTNKRIRIRRVHLEEDTGKLQHANIEGKPATLVDFNRSGVALVEIVTEPDIHSAEDAKLFLQKLQQIVRYLEISDADMEKGSMRLEPNISVSSLVAGSKAGGLPKYKVEVKNINSFRFAEKAINFEISRHIAILETGQNPVQETRGWSENKNATVSQRLKEEAQDYRYFPEPDIPPIHFEKNQIEDIKVLLPELPDAKKERFMRDYTLGNYDADLLTENRKRADYFEECVRIAERQASGVKPEEITPKMIANWLLNKQINIDETMPAKMIAQIIEARNVVEIGESDLNSTIVKVLSANEKAVLDFKNGKEQALMFLFGMVIRELKGQGDKQKIINKLREKLSSPT